jgi:signal peptidase I
MDLFCRSGEGAARLPMLSGSMAPSLLPGDVLLVVPSDGSRNHTGDIIVIKDGSRLIAHRLIFAFRARGRSLLIEKGDANPWAAVVKAGAVVGTIVSAEREGGTVYRSSPESRARGRSAAGRALARLLLLDMPVNTFKRMIGREV